MIKSVTIGKTDKAVKKKKKEKRLYPAYILK